jgi:hypothetical protein
MKSASESTLEKVGYFVAAGVLGTIGLTVKHMRQNHIDSFFGAMGDGKWWLIGLWLALAIVFLVGQSTNEP